MLDGFHNPNSIKPDCAPQGSEDLLVRLADDGLRKILTGDSSDLSRKVLTVKDATAADAWKIFKLIHLLNAAAYLRFGSFDRFELDIQGSGEPTQELSVEHDELPSLLDIMRTARQRELIYKALCCFRAGGPSGLFDAYEALTYELMRCGASDYSRDVGTVEWLAENGWASEEEIERFMKAVLHSRRDLDAPGGPGAISPPEAEAFVRRLLLKFICECRSPTSNLADTD